MKKKIFLVMVGALSLVAMLLWALPGQTAETLKIGYIGNFSWVIAGDAFYAAKLAVDEINKAGGIQGSQVELLSEDSRGQTPLATAAYKKLVMTRGAKMVILAEGTEINFACQEAGAELYPEFKHLAMNTCTSHEELGDKVEKNYNRYKFYFRPFLKTTSLETLEMVSVSGKAKFDKTHTYLYGYPYVTSARAQFQKDGQSVIVFPYDVSKATNPGKTFIPVKQLRKGQ